MKVPKKITLQIDLSEEQRNQLYEIMMQLESVVSKNKKKIYETIFTVGIFVVGTNLKNFLDQENGS